MADPENKDAFHDRGEMRSDDSRYTKKYQVFISSTFEDLIEERRSVIETVLAMNHIPVGMEVFEAGNEDQWTYIQNRISEIDYYIVIIAERYGSIGPRGISYTEMEYRFAVEAGVPVAALLLHDSSRASWPRNKIDFENQKQLNDFRNLCKSRMVNYWKDTGSLAAKCQLALSGLIRRHRRTGWIPGDQGISSSVLAELARLSKENAEMREALTFLNTKNKEDPERQKALSRINSNIQKLLFENRPMANFVFPPHPGLDDALKNTSILDLFSDSISEYFDGRTAYYFEELLAVSFIRRVNGMSVEGTGNWLHPFGAFLSLLLRSWGFVESFSAPRHDGKTTQWLKLSELGRSTFDEAWNARGSP